MTPDAVRPYDVYTMLVNLVAPMYVMFWMLVMLLAGMGVLIVLKFFSMSREFSTLSRIEKFLTTYERHVQVTDSKSDRTVNALEEVKVHAKAVAAAAVQAVGDIQIAVAEVPKKVIDEIKQADGAVSGERPITLPPA